MLVKYQLPLCLRSPLNDPSKRFRRRLLRKLDLPHVEGADTGDSIARVNHGGGPALGSSKDDVDELVRIWNLFKIN